MDDNADLPVHQRKFFMESCILSIYLKMKRRKLYYVPGMISIIGLPILLLFFGPKDKVWPRAIRISLPTDQKDVPGLIRFSRDYVYRSIKFKKIITVNLDQGRENASGGADILFYKRLQFISREIEQLQFTNDTFSVLKVQLGSDNTYGDFVWVFNQALFYRVKRFAFVDDTYFLFADPPREPGWEIMLDSPPADTISFKSPGR